MNKWAILALDGASLEDLHTLAPYSRFIREVRNHYTLSRTSCDLANTANAWASFLTASTFEMHGCTSFAKPSRSLLTMEVFEERMLGAAVWLPEQASSLIVNVPLLHPLCGTQRYWLSDGALPLQYLYSPGWLAQNVNVVESYRPFVHIDFNKSRLMLLNEAATVELTRLAVAEELIELLAPDLSIVRVGFFDIAGHLFHQELYSQKFSDVLCAVSSAIDRTAQALLSGGANVILLSCFSFQRCKQTVNLNSLLAAGGFCSLRHGGADKRSLARSFSGFGKNRWVVEPSQSLAYSPAHGTIYINSQARFHDGIVGSAEIAELRQEVLEYILYSCKKRHGEDLTGRICELPFLPDILLSSQGLDFTNNPDARPFDKPAGVHRGSGFLAYSQGPLNFPDQMKLNDAARTLSNQILTN